MSRYVSVMLSLLLISMLFSGVSFAGDSRFAPPLEDMVSVDNVKFHQRVLENIADGNGGSRASGNRGYDQSLSYIGFWLWVAGFDLKLQVFDFPYFEELSDPLMEQTLPDSVVYPPNDRAGFITMTYSGSGDVTAPVEAVDLLLPPAEEPNTSTSGCEPDDFTGFTAGNIALLQRGGCSFYDKAMNAQNAGAVGVIIFNEGQVGRVDAFGGTLGQSDFTVPIVGANFNIGIELSGLPGAEVRLTTDTISEIRETFNLIADTPGGDEKSTIMVGAHVDSVTAGPGINDNGSGTAAILETALKIGWLGKKYNNKVRFAFWGAEELGLHGSEYYVANLTPEAFANIRCYLNFDMIGSSNYVRFVYDGDGSDTDDAGPPGSELLEQFYVNYFDSLGLATEPTALDGRSDYAPFMDAGIPIAGLFTGAGGVKSEEEALEYGGTAGIAYDPYYHTPDDTLANVNFEVTEQMLKAIANSVETFASFPLPVSAVRAFRAQAYDFDYQGPKLRK
ncbi:MAG: M28 family peptidase [Desulfobacteraceae bacterium]|nr:M28 family peptidase [Desulfobacteraceae bacterium]